MAVIEHPLATNYHSGRHSPYRVDLIVIHVTEGDAASVVAWFSDPAADVSAHYMVRKDGAVVQFVDEGDTAWHAGRVHGCTASLVLERMPANPNGYSIGIEHEGDGTHELTTEQRAASVALIRDIANRHGIPLDRTHIVGHREIYDFKTCPGAIDVDVLVAEVGA
ncbi:MAG: N-acetylmuramoyl-L-alanine amidase [Methanomicrobiales archaeon]|nr:N-acetylmuramoyl-L-alanine amidase [Methanomicrobiales archaeon]